MIGIYITIIMKAFYVFFIQGFPTLFTDSNSFYAHYCHAHWVALIGVQLW